MFEKQHFQIHVKSVEENEEGIIIEGLASTPTIDRHDEIVEANAFADAISAFMTNPVLLLQHDSKKVIGRVLEARLTDTGLFVRAIVQHNIDEAMDQIRAGNLKGFSVGFIPEVVIFRHRETGQEITVEEFRRLSWDQQDEYRRIIKKLEWVELSVVSIPSNRHTLFSLKKSLKKFFEGLSSKSNPENMDKKEIKTAEEEVVETSESVEAEEVETVEEAEATAEVEEAEEVVEEEKSLEEEGEAEAEEAEADEVTEEPESSENSEEVAEAEAEEASSGDAESEEKAAPAMDQKELLEGAKEVIKQLMDAVSEKDAQIAELQKKLDKTPVFKGLFQGGATFQDGKAFEEKQEEKAPEKGDIIGKAIMNMVSEAKQTGRPVMRNLTPNND